jgi:signal recognition particle subunit SRP54
VNVRLVFQLTKSIRERAFKEQPPPGVSRKEWLVKLTYDELVKLFGGDRVPDVKPPYTPYVIMMVGVQGSGKTTTVGKLAKFYRDMGYRVGVVAADTYRPGAYDQLRQLAEKVGAMFYGEPDSKDPIGIARRGVEELKRRGADIIIIDTAGRHGYGEEKALLDEMKMIADAVNPDEVILVIDAAMGQKSYELAKRFHEATPVGSIIVTKMDGTAKGGGALSAVAATGAPIKFIKNSILLRVPFDFHNHGVLSIKRLQNSMSISAISFSVQKSLVKASRSSYVPYPVVPETP